MAKDLSDFAKYFTGHQCMTLNTLKIIADTLEVRVRDLIGKL